MIQRMFDQRYTQKGFVLLKTKICIMYVFFIYFNKPTYPYVGIPGL